MIFYDYKCKNNHKYEAREPISKPHTNCPKCGAKTKRVISKPYFHIVSRPGELDI